jgi:hypothetical protein
MPMLGHVSTSPRYVSIYNITLCYCTNEYTEWDVLIGFFHMSRCPDSRGRADRQGHRSQDYCWGRRKVRVQPEQHQGCSRRHCNFRVQAKGVYPCHDVKQASLSVPQNHTVTQSSFKDPCRPLLDSTGKAGFKSGLYVLVSPCEGSRY